MTCKRNGQGAITCSGVPHWDEDRWRVLIYNVIDVVDDFWGRHVHELGDGEKESLIRGLRMGERSVLLAFTLALGGDGPDDEDRIVEIVKAQRQRFPDDDEVAALIDAVSGAVLAEFGSGCCERRLD